MTHAIHLHPRLEHAAIWRVGTASGRLHMFGRFLSQYHDDVAGKIRFAAHAFNYTSRRQTNWDGTRTIRIEAVISNTNNTTLP